MTADKKKGFSDKHRTGEQPDVKIENEIRSRIKADTLPCAVAFKIASDLEVSPAAVGKTADLIRLHLAKCQLGLFGYTPEKKIVIAKPPEHPELENAVNAVLADGRLSCRAAWEIAERLNVSKMSVSSACEYLAVKIKPCQLGAF
jgi:hypothetical protein